MVKRLNFKKVGITFVFRHKWDKNELIYSTEFGYYRIGLWFKKNKIVGRKNFNKPKEWNNNLVNDYMIGVDLLVCKAWVSFNRGGMCL